MHLRDLEPDSQRSSPFAHADPRVKIVCAAVVMVSAVGVLQENPGWLAGIGGLLALLSLPSRVPLRYVGLRLLIALPLLALIGASVPFLHSDGTPAFTIPMVGWTVTAEGLRSAAGTAAKSLLCIWTATLLWGTTDFTHLLDGLARSGAPSLVVMLMAMIYRYLFVIGDEALRLLRAREARGRPANLRQSIHSTGSMVGALMVRCLGRSERLANAMIARGFDGTFPVMHGHRRPTWAEFALGGAVCLLASSIAVLSHFT